MGFVLTARPRDVQALNRRRLLAISVTGLVLALAAVLLAAVDVIPLLAQFNSRIAPNSLVLNMLKTKVEAVHIQAYLFNVTNAGRFAAGLDARLRLAEVGPFTYREIREHQDLELDQAEGVLRYTPHVTTEFMPEESIADPKDVTVTMPSLSFMSSLSMASSYNFWTKLPLNLMIKKMNLGPTITIKAHDYLWGYKDPLITMGNSFIPGWITFDTMGVMDRLYDQKISYRIEVSAGSRDKFLIKKINGVEGMNSLGYDDSHKRSRCNTFEDAYEGIAYPARITRDTKIRIWRSVLCRMMELDYVEDRPMPWGGKALVYKISNRTYNAGPDKDCICDKTPKCRNGISNLSPCFYGLPFSISNAHFTGADPNLFERLEGIEPDENKYGSEFLIEPTLGMALKTNFTMQLNVVMGDVRYNPEASPYSDMVLPVGYFRIVQPALKKEQLSDLWLMCTRGPKILLAVQITLFLIGVMLMGYTLRTVTYAALCVETRQMEFTTYNPYKKTQDSPLMSLFDDEDS